ncbi:hypothetical protein N0V91_008231 [Didymella pomorum]|uniref:Uncharacterized protein n=1 Tax=Didymella pomorum TaxID=749634 RepID=A0A9W8ZBT9_9PLEO|nr:hypothetical protein N0V91_008231 [Didymella pomorum]
MKAPNPAHGYTGPPATRKKPGQASSWKPVNTFGVQGTNPNHGKGKTYGNKVKRNVAQLSEREKWFPGREILPQQQLAREEANVSGPGVISGMVDSSGVNAASTVNHIYRKPPQHSQQAFWHRDEDRIAGYE